MKKFISNILIYTLVLCPIILALDVVYIYQNRKRDESAKFLDVPSNVEICNFGSSHGKRSFDYEDLEEAYTCFNFGLDSQSLSYDLRILKNYEGNFEKKATVFITVSYFSFFGKDETEKDNFVSQNRRYYKFLPKELTKEYDFKTALVVNYFPALFDHANFFPVLLGYIERDSDIWLTTIDAEKAVADAKTAAYRHLITYGTDDNGERVRNQKEIDALYEMIAVCKAKEMTPILVTTPYLAEYSNAVRQIDPGFYDDFYGIMEAVVGETGVPYFDYAMDARFRNDYSLFINSDHLNKDGARKFTDILVEEALGIIP